MVDWARTDTPKGFEMFYILLHDMAPPEHALEWIRAIYDHKNVVIEAFRGSTKTTTMMTYLAYRIGLEPHKTNLIVQVGDGIASDNAAAVAGYIEYNEGWKLCFPDVGEIAPGPFD